MRLTERLPSLGINRKSINAPMTKRLSPLLSAFVLFLSFISLASSYAEEVTVPTLEWVLTESDRSGLGNKRLRRLLGFVDSLDTAEFEPTIHRLAENLTYGRFSNASQMLYSRWWTIDRDAVLKYLLTLEGDTRSSAMGTVLGFWAVEDPMTAWQWFEENSDDARSVAGHLILREIVRSDPALALELFEKRKRVQNSIHDWNPGFLYGNWAVQDPVAAAAHLDASAMPPNKKASAITSIVSIWIRNDADAAWQWAKSIRSPEARYRAMEKAIGFLAISDIERADKLMEDFPEGMQRQSAISSLVGTLYLQQPDKAFAMVQKHGGARIEGMILGRWAISDADKALEVAKTQLSVGPRQQYAFNEIIRNVASRDIDQAIRILGGFPPASNQIQGATLIATQLAEQSVEKARHWAEKLPEGEAKKAAMSEVASKWVAEAAEDAATYALDQAAINPSNDLLRRTLSHWGYKDPKTCAQWITSHLEEDNQLTHLSSAVSSWAEHEPDAASKWTAALPEGEVRDACIGRLGSQWGYHHPADGAKWLEGLKAGKARDEAISNFVQRSFEYLPEEALEWCAQIDDPDRQKRAIQQIASKYLRSQPEKARQWIQSSSLSDELKKSLLGE